MKMILTVIAIAMIGLLFACLLPMLTQHDKFKVVKRRGFRARFVPLSPLERIFAPFVMAMRSLASRFNAPPGGTNRVALANDNLALQCRNRNVRLKADAAVTRYLMVKYGSDAEHAAICGAAGIPLGNSDDAPAAAEDPFTVEIFGLGCCERIVIASEAIAANVDVYTAANGKVQDLPAGAGTYYLVGRSSQSAAGDGDKLRIVPCFPQKLVVA